MLGDAVIARLRAGVPALAGRVEGAAELAALQRQNQFPQVTPAAHVIPLGLSAASPTALAGNFRQEVDRRIGVILTVRTHDATGSRALAGVDALVEAIVAAISGWTPDPGSTGVFRLLRAEVAAMREGTLVWQIEFALADRIRSS
jgi:hypothetical protein